MASRFRCKLKNLQFQTNGGSLTWYTPTATPLTPYFNPLHQPQTPVFTKKLSPKVLFFPHCSKFWKLFTQTPQIGWKKGTQMPPIFMAFVTERPQIFCLACKCLRGMLLPQTWSEAGKFCILETESCNLVNTFIGANLIKVMKTKFQFYRLNRSNCNNFIGGQGWYTGHHILVKHGRGYILQPSSVWFCTSWFSKQMPSVPEVVQAEAF